MTLIQRIFILVLKSPFLPFFHSETKVSKGELDNITYTTTFLNQRGITVTLRNGKACFYNPTLFYSNHVTFLDTLVLLSVLPVKKLYFIALIVVGMIYPVIRPTQIPVSSFTFVSKKNYWAKILSCFRLVEGVDSETALKINRRVIKKATDALLNGYSVLIFPDGGLHSAEWFTGIGYILDELRHHEGSRTVWLQPIYVSGISDQLIFQQNLRMMFHQPLKKIDITVNLGQTIEFSKFVKKYTSELHSSTVAKKFRDDLKSMYIEEQTIILNNES